MNLWFRLLTYLVCAPWRPTIISPADVSRLSFRVLPNDLDASLHMNNGRYLSLMDLGRIDFLFGTGLARVIWRNRWTPIGSAVVIRYRRELTLFQRFAIETRLLTWAEASVIMEQVFVILSGPLKGQVAARALFKGGIYSRTEKSFIDIPRLMREIGVEATSPPASAEVEAFLKADSALKVSSAQRNASTAESID